MVSRVFPTPRMLNVTGVISLDSMNSIMNTGPRLILLFGDVRWHHCAFEVLVNNGMHRCVALLPRSCFYLPIVASQEHHLFGIGNARRLYIGSTLNHACLIGSTATYY